MILSKYRENTSSFLPNFDDREKNKLAYFEAEKFGRVMKAFCDNAIVYFM